MKEWQNRQHHLAVVKAGGRHAAFRVRNNIFVAQGHGLRPSRGSGGIQQDRRLPFSRLRTKLRRGRIGGIDENVRHAGLGQTRSQIFRGKHGRQFRLGEHQLQQRERSQGGQNRNRLTRPQRSQNLRRKMKRVGQKNSNIAVGSLPRDSRRQPIVRALPTQRRRSAPHRRSKRRDRDNAPQPSELPRQWHSCSCFT